MHYKKERKRKKVQHLLCFWQTKNILHCNSSLGGNSRISTERAESVSLCNKTEQHVWLRWYVWGDACVQPLDSVPGYYQPPSARMNMLLKKGKLQFTTLRVSAGTERKPLWHSATAVVWRLESSKLMGSLCFKYKCCCHEAKKTKKQKNNPLNFIASQAQARTEGTQDLHRQLCSHKYSHKSSFYTSYYIFKMAKYLLKQSHPRYVCLCNLAKQVEPSHLKCFQPVRIWPDQSKSFRRRKRVLSGPTGFNCHKNEKLLIF